ncbi:hypothetical protein diail_11889 [Diaporthe ilicicola]|nr:hypothetical protein diail_11889 [Diaporthe ilicicola]
MREFENLDELFGRINADPKPQPVANQFLIRNRGANGRRVSRKKDREVTTEGSNAIEHRNIFRKGLERIMDIGGRRQELDAQQRKIWDLLAADKEAKDAAAAATAAAPASYIDAV